MIQIEARDKKQETDGRKEGSDVFVQTTVMVNRAWRARVTQQVTRADEER